MDTIVPLAANVYGVSAVGSTFYARLGVQTPPQMGSIIRSTNSGTSWIVKTTADGLGSNSARDVYVSGSSVYAATVSGLSVSTNGGANWTNCTTANGLGSNFVNGVFADGNGIYAATYLGGVGVSTTGGTSWANYTTADGLVCNEGNGVYADSGFIYAATQNGLSIAAVPEPSTYCLALAGLACGGYSMWRRRIRT